MTANPSERLPACFHEGTLIHVEGGKLKAMAELSAGDMVLARSGITGELAYKRIINKRSHEHNVMRALICSFGPTYYEKYGDNYPVLVTPDTPFWIVGKGWTPVADLKEGDPLLTHDACSARVEMAMPDPSYFECSLEVEDFHSYFVHPAGLLVRDGHE